MGTTFSHPPPPLVEISGPRNKVLVPAGTSFTVNPSGYPFDFPSFRGRYNHNQNRPPIYHRVRSLYVDDHRPRGRLRDRGRRRPPSDDTATTSDMSFDNAPPGRRGPRPGRTGMGMGGPMGMGPRRPSRPPPGPGAYMMDSGDLRAHSVPDLPMGYGYPGGRGPPRAGPRGMNPAMPHGMSPNLVGGMSPGVPPGYGGGMGSNPYAFQPGRAPTPGRVQTPLAMPVPQQARRPMRAPGLNEIPMGAYAAGAPPPVRANTEPPTSSRLNRRQSSNKKVGPSGQEWIEGDPFLDACTCTTNCTCRKGQRVLYRSQAQDGDGHNGWGEIRYVLKDDLGKDCGDHSKCHNRNHDDDSEGKKRRKKKGKAKKQVNESDEFQEEMRECMKAMQEDLAGMKLKDRSGKFGMPPSSPFGGMPPNGPHPGMMEGMDPCMAARLAGGPFGMGEPGRLPPHPGMGGRPDRMHRVGMSGPGMPPGMDFDDEMSYSESGFGMDDMMGHMEMGGPSQPRMGGRRPMPPDPMGGPHPRRPRGRGGPRGPPPDSNMGMGSFGRGPPPPIGGRGMGGRRPRNGGRRRPPPPPPESEDDDFHMDRRMGGGGGPRDGYAEMDYDDDDGPWEDEHDGDGGPRMRHSPPGRGGDGGRPGRHMNRGGGTGRQPHVEDGEDDID